MTIEELEERLRQKSYRENADRIQAAVLADPTTLLPYLTKRFLRGEAEGASITGMAWGNVARARPGLVQSWQEQLFRASVTNHRAGIRRNVIRYFSEIPVLLDDDHPIPKWVKRKDFFVCRSSKLSSQRDGPYYLEPELEGRLLDHLLSVVADPHAEAAPIAFGMQVLVNLALKYPDLTHECIPTIQEAGKHGTAGVKHRAKWAVALLERLQGNSHLR